jgi:hypothetical protein
MIELNKTQNIKIKKRSNYQNIPAATFCTIVGMSFGIITANAQAASSDTGFSGTFNNNVEISPTLYCFNKKDEIENGDWDQSAFEVCFDLNINNEFDNEIVDEWVDPNIFKSESFLSRERNLEENINESSFDLSYQEYYYDNLFKFKKAFDEQLIKYNHFLTVDLEHAQKDFYATAEKLSSLNFSKATAEFLDENSIKFSMRFSDNKLLMVSKSFVELPDVNKSQIVYSIFENKKRISSDVLEIDTFMENIKELLTV